MAKAGVVQLCSNMCVHDNLQTLLPLFAAARDQDVDVLVLPENFACMGRSDTGKFAISETPGQGEIQNFLRMAAIRFGFWVIAGTLPLKGASNRVRASSLVFDDKGLCVARYDKIHLFDVQISETESHQESLTIERGHDLVVVETPIGHVGLSVCYDLRFPELYRGLVLKGAELFSIPSAFTATTGLAHWDVLLRARAIENLCYVLAPNQGGQHANGRHTYGHSMIVEPWGSVMASLPTGVGLIVAEIDLSRLRELRRTFPCHDHHVY